MAASDVIKLLDSHTNEQVAYYPVTTWADGTAMDDSKVDNVIYRKAGGTYYKRAFTGAASVKWFGAVGDGVSNDSPAIRSAISLLGVVFQWLNFSDGTYLLGDGSTPTSLVISNRENIKITGKGATLIANGANPATPDYSILSFVDCNNVVVEDLSLNGQVDLRTPLTSDPSGQNTQHNIAIFQGCANITLRNIISIKSMMDGIFVGRDNITLLTSYVSSTNAAPSNILVDNCVCQYNLRQGISVVGCDGLIVKGGEYSYTGKIKGIAPSDGMDLEGWTDPGGGAGLANLNVLVDSVLAEENVGYGISLNSNTQGCTVVNSIIQNNNESGVLFDYRTYNNLVQNCTIKNNVQDRTKEQVEISMRGSLNAVIGNRIYTTNNAAISAPSSPTPASGRIIKDNYIENTDQSLTASSSGNIYVEATSPARDIVTGNYLLNTFYKTANYASLYVSSSNGIIKDNKIIATISEIATISMGFRLVNTSHIGKNECLGYKAGTPTSTVNQWNTAITQLEVNGDQLRLIGSGAPNGVVIAGKGSEYIQTDAAGHAVKWLKIAGQNYDNTGWAPIQVMQAGATANRPQNPIAGELYYDTTLSMLIVYNGTAWVNAIAIASASTQGTVLKAAALTNAAPSATTVTSPAAAATYTQADVQKMVDDITHLVAQVNALQTRYEELITKQQAAGQQS